MKNIPYITLFFIVLGNIKLNYQFESSSLSLPGPKGGAVIVGIILLIVSFKIFNIIHLIVEKRGHIKCAVKFKYDLLIPFSFLAGMIGYVHNHNPADASPVLDKFEWTLVYGSANEDFAIYILSIIALTLFLRILSLLHAIHDNS
jgi:hypothetical protein